MFHFNNMVVKKCIPQVQLLRHKAKLERLSLKVYDVFETDS